MHSIVPHEQHQFACRANILHTRFIHFFVHAGMDMYCLKLLHVPTGVHVFVYIWYIPTSIETFCLH